jgi:hypothetical protein
VITRFVLYERTGVVAAGGLVILDLPELHEVEYKERIDLD